MDEPQLVGAREPSRDVRTDATRLGLRKPSSGDPRRERLALQELHDEVRHGALSPSVEERAHVGVREARRDLCLACKPPQCVGVLPVARADDLDRHLPLEARVVRPVHLSHTPGPERREDLVGPEARPLLERHVSGAATPVFLDISAT